MKAKEYLKQVERLNVIVNQKIEEKSKIIEQILSVNSPDPSKEYVQSSPSGDAAFVNRISELVELEAEIDHDIDALIDLKHKIIGQLHELSEAKMIRILYRRYIDLEPFEKIAAELNYSIRNVYKIHGYGLQEFQEKFLKNE